MPVLVLDRSAAASVVAEMKVLLAQLQHTLSFAQSAVSATELVSMNDEIVKFAYGSRVFTVEALDVAHEYKRRVRSLTARVRSEADDGGEFSVFIV